ncbi:MAG: lanthionine synthetase LanC family protein [Gammaproteobacteria bacterium]
MSSNQSTEIESQAVSANVSAADDQFSLILDAKLAGSGSVGASEYAIASSTIWTHCRHQSSNRPSQGWKLHISATVWNAADVLDRTLGILIQERVTFKFPRDAATLRQLNQGVLGASQVGKFLSIYPHDDDQAKRLAERLHFATIGFIGPSVPTDKKVCSASLVSFRYGAFTALSLVRPTGETLSALRAPDGTLVPDVRGRTYQQPAWISADPFGGGVGNAMPPAPGTVVDKRLLVVGTLADVPRGAVLLAIDLLAGRRCILKSAIKGSQIDQHGNDARHQLRNEALTLQTLPDDERFPKCYGFIELGDVVLLEMEEFEGVRLDELVHKRVSQGKLLRDQEVIHIGIQVTSALASLHQQGLAHGDIKSTNIIVAPDGDIRLIDFGMACPVEHVTGRHTGTPGYRSERCAARSADLYAVGALLYFLATGAEPSNAPDTTDLLARPVRLLNPDISAALAELIGRCLAGLDARFVSAEALLGALHACPTTPPMQHRALDACRAADRAAPAQRALEACRRTAYGLCGPTADGATAHAHDVHAQHRATDLGNGTAGIVLALAETSLHVEDAPLRQALYQRSLELAANADDSRPFPGLYFGEAGVGAALLRSAQVLGDSALRHAAMRRSESIARQPFGSPDLYVGTAGRLRFHLMLWNETADDGALNAALDAGQHLLRSAYSEHNACYWTIPAGYEKFSGKSFIGYAHGAAGIADALLDLFEATGETAYLVIVRQVVRWLTQHAARDPEHGLLLNWPDVPGGRLTAPFWCHGAAGIGSFLIRAARIAGIEEAEDMARQSAFTVARATRWLSPGQCHGLAGSIEFLLDMYQATEVPTYLDDAHAFAQILGAFASERGEHLMWHAAPPDQFSFDYLTGAAGIALSLSRLSDPGAMPRQLSTAGFRWKGKRAADAADHWSLPPRAASIRSSNPCNCR